ncbi:MAG: cupin domain-containing protein [Bacteroidales bacterium]|nr:cupin domain-containing protein [Bacteroidales bacterium]
MKTANKEIQDIDSAQYWIDKFQLEPHPEAGYFRQIYRSEYQIPDKNLPDRFDNERSVGTVIYYLLEGDTFSAFHRLKSDEMWFFLGGDSLVIHKLEEPKAQSIKLDRKTPSTLIPHDVWFAAETESADSFALVSCVVFPGFDYADFELADKQELKKHFPEATELIERLSINKT